MKGGTSTAAGYAHGTGKYQRLFDEMPGKIARLPVVPRGIMDRKMKDALGVYRSAKGPTVRVDTLSYLWDTLPAVSKARARAWEGPGLVPETPGFDDRWDAAHENNRIALEVFMDQALLDMDRQMKAKDFETVRMYTDYYGSTRNYKAERLARRAASRIA